MLPSLTSATPRVASRISDAARSPDPISRKSSTSGRSGRGLNGATDADADRDGDGDGATDDAIADGEDALTVGSEEAVPDDDATGDAPTRSAAPCEPLLHPKSPTAASATADARKRDLHTPPSNERLHDILALCGERTLDATSRRRRKQHLVVAVRRGAAVSWREAPQMRDAPPVAGKAKGEQMASEEFLSFGGTSVRSRCRPPERTSVRSIRGGDASAFPHTAELRLARDHAGRTL